MTHLQFSGLDDFYAITQEGPAAPYMGAAETPDSESSSKSSSKSSGKLLIGGLDSDMIKWLYQKGLRSDVEAFMTQMDFAIEHAFNPITGKAELGMFKLLIPTLAQIGQEKEQFDKAMELARANKSLGEVAISDRGGVYALDESGQIEEISPDESKGRRLLTNGEIARVRAIDPTVGAFKADFTSTVANSTSTELIVKLLNETLTNLGSTSSKSTLFQNIDGSVLKGALQILTALKDGKDLLKTTIESLNSNEDLQNTLKFLLANMPANMQALLTVKAMLTNTTPTELISSYVLSKNTVVSNVTLDIVKGHDSTSGDSSKSSTNLVKVDPFLELTLSQGGQKEKVTLIPGTNVAYTSEARTFNQLVNRENKDVRSGSLSNILQGDGIGRLVDQNDIYIGTEHVDPAFFNQVYVNTGKVTRMRLPVVTEENGLKHPAYKFFKAIEEFKKRFSDLSLKSAEGRKIAMAVIKKTPSLSPYILNIDNSGNFIYNDKMFEPYYIMTAFANADKGGTFSDDVSTPINLDSKSLEFNNWATKLTGSIEKLQIEIMRNALGDEYKNLGDVYRLALFLPMNADSKAGLASSGQLTYDISTDTPTRHTDIRYGERETVSNTSASLLGN